MDKITVDRIALLHPLVRDKALVMYGEICKSLTGNAYCRFSHTLRTNKEQADLFAIGRTVKGRKVTNANAGRSYHNYGLALDIVLIVDNKVASWDTLKDFDNDTISDWQEVVKIIKSYGWEHGGDWAKFKDQPHFQMTFGKSIDQLINMKKNGVYPII